MKYKYTGRRSHMQHAFKLFSAVVFLSVFFILPNVYVSAQEDFRTPKFGIFYPPTITNTPTPTKTPTPTLSPQSPENNEPPLPPPNPQLPRFPTPTPSSSCPELIPFSKQIIDSLSKGFWRYYNYSSLYPQFFDDDLYQETRGNVCVGEDENGNPYPEDCTGERPHAFQLFWCTWLPMKTYERLGLYMPQNLYSVAKMQNWFEGQGRYLPPNTRWSDIPLGSAIFFRNPGHVALVIAKKSQYITIHESNNYVARRTLTVSRSGMVEGGINTITGFGAPPTQCK